MFNDLPDSMKTTYTALGALTANWAGVEYVIDNIIWNIHLKFDGSSVASTPPRSFSQKPTYLRTVFANHRELAPYLGTLNTHLTEATEIADIRDWCAHGIWLRSVGDSLILEVGRVMRGQHYKRLDKRFTVKQIEKAAHRALILYANLFFFGAEAVGIIPKDEFDDPVRNLVSKRRPVVKKS